MGGVGTANCTLFKEYKKMEKIMNEKQKLKKKVVRRMERNWR